MNNLAFLAFITHVYEIFMPGLRWLCDPNFSAVTAASALCRNG